MSLSPLERMRRDERLRQAVSERTAAIIAKRTKGAVAMAEDSKQDNRNKAVHWAGTALRELVAAGVTIVLLAGFGLGVAAVFPLLLILIVWVIGLTIAACAWHLYQWIFREISKGRIR